MLELRRTYGDVARFRMGPKWIYAIGSAVGAHEVLVSSCSDYEKGIGQNYLRTFLGDGLLTATEPHWSRKRQIVRSALDRRTRSWQMAIAQECTEAMLSRWRRAA